MNESQYKRLVDELSPKSPILKNCIKAFLVGGAICCLGQLVLTGYKALGLDEEMASTAASTIPLWVFSRERSTEGISMV